jgi:hypothetical protein
MLISKEQFRVRSLFFQPQQVADEEWPDGAQRMSQEERWMASLVIAQRRFGTAGRHDLYERKPAGPIPGLGDREGGRRCTAQDDRPVLMAAR